MTVTLDSQNFDSEVIKSATPVLVDFWSQRCMPCLMLSPILEEISEELKDKVKIAKLNLDNFPEYAEKYQIEAIPAMIYFDGGEIKNTIVGLRSKESLLEILQLT